MKVRSIEQNVKQYWLMGLLLVVMALAIVALSPHLTSKVAFQDNAPAFSIEEMDEGYDMVGKPCKYSSYEVADSAPQKGVSFKFNADGVEVAGKSENFCGYAWSD